VSLSKELLSHFAAQTCSSDCDTNFISRRVNERLFRNPAVQRKRETSISAKLKFSGKKEEAAGSNSETITKTDNLVACVRMQ
jgi:hypothetical protein